MRGIRHRAPWSRAVLGLLAALALLFVPMAGAQAMPCHDPVGHRHAAAVLELSFPIVDHQDQKAEGAIVDHERCCNASCAVCLAVTGREGAAILQRASAGSRFGWSDQTGSDVVLPPKLDPPRLPA